MHAQRKKKAAHHNRKDRTNSCSQKIVSDSQFHFETIETDYFLFKMQNTAGNTSPIDQDRTFPFILHGMLEDADLLGFSDIISWLPGTNYFKVHDTKAFTKTVMQSYFAQTQYKSFHRQLNLYCFKRIKKGPFQGAYSHLLFLRGQSHLCQFIIRVKNKNDPPKCLLGFAPTTSGLILPTSRPSTTEDYVEQSEGDSNEFGVAFPGKSITMIDPQGTGLNMEDANMATQRDVEETISFSNLHEPLRVFSETPRMQQASVVPCSSIISSSSRSLLYEPFPIAGDETSLTSSTRDIEKDIIDLFKSRRRQSLQA